MWTVPTIVIEVWIADRIGLLSVVLMAGIGSSVIVPIAMWIAPRIVRPIEAETGLLIVLTSVWMIGIAAMIARLSDRLKDVTIGIPGIIGTAVNLDGETVDLSAWPIGRRSGPSSDLWTTATGRVVAAAAVDSAILAVVTVAAGGIFGITGISAHRAAVAVVADIASSRAVDIIRSATRTMGVGVGVVARMVRGSSRRPRPSRWCRRNL